MRNARQRWSIRLPIVLALAGVALLAGAGVALADGSAQPGGITSEAHEMHKLYLFVLILGGIVFLAVEGALIFMIVRYRKRDDRLPVQTHGNNLLEIVWTTIPVVIVIVLFVFSFIVLVDVEHKSKPETMTVEVTGFQWQWQFVYNQNDLGPGSDPNAKGQVTIIGTAKTEPTLVLPVGQPVEFQLISHDVIHSFFVRDFLYKLDVIPGRDNKFTVTPKEKGEFIGQCAELCGLDHALMRFHVKVVDKAEFDKFIADQLKGSQSAAAAPK